MGPAIYRFDEATAQREPKCEHTNPRNLPDGIQSWWCRRYQCLLLFDAVDRSTIGDTDIIPDNVNFAFHARRNELAGSREMFGNCGKIAAPGVKYEEEFFYCTHGGVGGTPWDEAKPSGYIHEMTTGQKAGMRTVGAASGILALKAANNFIRENDPTNVTLEQDKAGSRASWEWMRTKMQSVRHLSLLTG